MNDITFRKVLDNEGNFKHLELIQGDQTISISLGNTFASGKHSYVWTALREVVDKLSEDVSEEAKTRVIG